MPVRLPASKCHDCVHPPHQTIWFVSYSASINIKKVTIEQLFYRSTKTKIHIDDGMLQLRDLHHWKETSICFQVPKIWNPNVGLYRIAGTLCRFEETYTKMGVFILWRSYITLRWHQHIEFMIKMLGMKRLTHWTDIKYMFIGAI